MSVPNSFCCGIPQEVLRVFVTYVSNICYTNVYSEICTKVCRKSVQKGETNYYYITIPKLFT